MKLMRRRAAALLIMCAAFVFGFVFFLVSYAQNAASWATYPVNAHLFSSGRLVSAGDIYDRDGIVLATTTDGARTYNPSAGVRRALMHTVGDGFGNVATSLQATQRSRLTGWNFVTGAYAYKSNGGNITTTLDAGLCREALSALGGSSGAVGVMNYKTGEMICIVSSPTFDPANPPNIATNPDAYEGVYMNRLLSSSYTPGSIFKLVTLAAAIDSLPGASGEAFVCTGELELEGGSITCPKAHGEQSLERALSNSCNCAFASLAARMGGKTLEKYAEIAGLGGGTTLEGVQTARGGFSLEDATEAQLGWAAIGQHKDLVNPLTYLRFVGAIANGGVAVQPRLIEKNSLLSAVGGQRLLSGNTAARVAEAMRYAVENNYGELGLKGYGLCAKSGTAQIGGSAKPHAWFTGFLQSDEAPLAFIVIVENGGAGSSAAAKVAQSVMRYAVGLEY